MSLEHEVAWDSGEEQGLLKQKRMMVLRGAGASPITKLTTSVLILNILNKGMVSFCGANRILGTREKHEHLFAFFFFLLTKESIVLLDGHTPAPCVRLVVGDLARDADEVERMSKLLLRRA